MASMLSSISPLGIKSMALFQALLVVLLGFGPLALAQSGAPENLRISNVVARIVTRYCDCLDIEDFSCALVHLETMNGMDLSEYERSRYWNMLAWISFLSGDFESSL